MNISLSSFLPFSSQDVNVTSAHSSHLSESWLDDYVLLSYYHLLATTIELYCLLGLICLSQKTVDVLTAGNRNFFICTYL